MNLSDNASREFKEERINRLKKEAIIINKSLLIFKSKIDKFRSTISNEDVNDIVDLLFKQIEE